ncbi:MAG: amidohydrolase family protein [Methanomicrobiaceae archaeon]|nr:amidohydrolase family protein [Methanomicrobiaceae archaeon]
MDREIVVSGRAYLGCESGMRDVEISVRDGIIESIDEVDRAEDRWIFPCLFNSHTHLADTVAMDVRAEGSLSDLVAPPGGLKHRILAQSGRDILAEGIRKSISFMMSSATPGFCDFREGGVEGVSILRSALEGSGADAVILGRDGGEEVSDGIGVSSTKEGVDVLERAASTKKRGGFVAFHAGEKDDRDIDPAIDAGADMLVHCTHATDRQLKRCADEGISIAVCPRSNWILGVASGPENPPVKKMIEYGCNVVLGTDNVMFVQPDMFQEMAFLSAVYGASPEEAIDTAVAGSEIFGRSHCIEVKNKAAFYTVDPSRANLSFSRDPVKTVANRMNFSFIERMYFMI